MMIIPKRTQKSLNGLKNMINYINRKYPVNNLSILEIGSWVGSSAVEFAKRFKNVYCVDAWEPIKNTITNNYNMQDVEKEFDKNIKVYENVYKIKALSQDYVKNVKNKQIDIIYIDGEHNYEAVKRDLVLWLSKCRLFITGHDYWQSRFPGVIKAVNEIIGKPDMVFHDTSWIKYIGR